MGVVAIVVCVVVVVEPIYTHFLKKFCDTLKPVADGVSLFLLYLYGG